MTDSPDPAGRRPRVRRVRRTRFRPVAAVAAVWLLVWIMVSIALIDIGIEQLTTGRGALSVAAWFGGTGLGYVASVAFLLLSLRRRSKD